MPKCQSCGNHVSESFIRVFGQDGKVVACRSCAGTAEIVNGAAAGRR